MKKEFAEELRKQYESIDLALWVTRKEAELIRNTLNKIPQACNIIDQLQAELERLKKAFEWFKTDLKEIKTMNEPTFHTICQRWMPHIDKTLKGD